MTPRSSQPAWILRFDAKHRLAVALAAAALTYVLVQAAIPVWHMRVLAAWDVGAAVYLARAWLLVARSDVHATRDHALAQDMSGFIIFLLIVAAACASTIAIVYAAGAIKGQESWTKAVSLALTLGALASSWLLIQTMFALHYAHRYYSWRHHDPDAAAPLAFPGRGEPDYLDFVYYSFVVGMTSQVSDVAVVSRAMRRLTLIHGVMSFAFNIVVLALSINIFASVI
jgi:uncharacterized membrane protein